MLVASYSVDRLDKMIRELNNATTPNSPMAWNRIKTKLYRGKKHAEIQHKAIDRFLANCKV
jgi:hypothetical protein